MSGGAPHGALPWDVAGTTFQSRVWRYLLSISSEEAQSDQQLTRGIGQPTAVWAVARECATTRVASVILYHRVIWGEEELSGYRWGLERQQTLLDQERAASL